jgi:hypothetical protein
MFFDFSSHVEGSNLVRSQNAVYTSGCFCEQHFEAHKKGITQTFQKSNTETTKHQTNLNTPKKKNTNSIQTINTAYNHNYNQTTKQKQPKNQNQPKPQPKKRSNTQTTYNYNKTKNKVSPPLGEHEL